MQPSSLPFLLAGLVLAVGYLALRAERRGVIGRAHRRGLWSLLAVLVAWATLSAVLAVRGVYLSPGVLRFLPGLWLPLVPLVFVGGAVAASSRLRFALMGTLDATPAQWIVWIEALRIGALGTLVKTHQGDFPLHFELGVGLADLAVGLSALLVVRALARGTLGWRGLAVWHLVGFAVVALPAPLLAQMGLPGPLYVFDVPPTSRALFVYPVALAPTAVVPIFLAINLWAAAWLSLRRPAAETLRSGVALVDSGQHLVEEAAVGVEHLRQHQDLVAG